MRVGRPITTDGEMLATWGVGDVAWRRFCEHEQVGVGPEEQMGVWCDASQCQLANMPGSPANTITFPPYDGMGTSRVSADSVELREIVDSFRAACQRNPDKLAAQMAMGKLKFAAFLLSPANDAVGPAPEQRLDQPLAHYWVASSHRSCILSGDHLTGTASAVAYRRLLLHGVRCLDITCCDGADGQPVVTCGGSFVTEERLENVLRAIAENAFDSSELPVILSLEVVASPPLPSPTHPHPVAIPAKQSLTAPPHPCPPHPRCPSLSPQVQCKTPQQRAVASLLTTILGLGTRHRTNTPSFLIVSSPQYLHLPSSLKKLSPTNDHTAHCSLLTNPAAPPPGLCCSSTRSTKRSVV